ncbi:MAG TPA: cytochrome c3 family protein [Acidobacteriota bacterium]|nr:cytochrome c3 family protein [Acidobacteriota bacterium]
MGQIFHRSTNAYAKLSIAFGALLVVILGWVAFTLHGSPYVTRQYIPREQKVPFSHRHHIAGLGIDCRYCHTSVEESSFAGIPATETCMSCHSQVWTEAPMLEPVRASWRDELPLEWNRVHDLPDFAYFNHSVHIKKGVGCVTCHGQVDQMPLIMQTQTLHMGWCLDCHRNPELYVRPREEVFNVNWTLPEGVTQRELGLRLVEEYDIRSLQSCSTCHR